MPTVDTPRITATGTFPRITVNVVTGTGDGGGGAVDSVNGQTGTVVLGASDVGALPDDTEIPDITGLQATSEKNQANGYAGLDGDGTIPDNRIPSSIARDTEIGTQITAHDGSGTAHSTLFAGKVSTSAIDTDITLAADSDTRVPSQKAVKAAIAAAAGGLEIPGRDVGSYRSMPFPTAHNVSGLSGTTASSLLVTGLTPMVVRRRTAFDRIGVHCSTAATDAGSVVELGYCAAASSDLLPDMTTLVSAGDASITTTGLKEITWGTPQVLEPGLYWLLLAPKSSGTWVGTNPQFFYNVSTFALNAVEMSSSNFTGIPRMSRTANAPLSHASHTLAFAAGTGAFYPRVGMRVSGFP